MGVFLSNLLKYTNNCSINDLTNKRTLISLKYFAIKHGKKALLVFLITKIICRKLLIVF